jgi:catechol 2,3-dioxygenase-like lactoylglutathione lyase family enzyme
MFSSGNATVHVAHLSAAIKFYTETLGFTLTNRFGDRWATVWTGPSYWTTDEVRAGLILGLRPASPESPAPGTLGGVGFGLETYAPAKDVAATLTTRGVRVDSEIISFEAGNVFSFVDLDGVASYVNEFPPGMIDEDDKDRHAASGADKLLLSGGHAIVYVSDMDDAIRFYADTLGLNLTNRFENHFATVEVGRSLVLGIHPRTPNTPIPGTKGSVTLSLVVDEPLDTVLARLAQRGVRTTGHAQPGRSAYIEDLDGNVITLWEAHAFAREGELAASGVAARG